MSNFFSTTWHWFKETFKFKNLRILSFPKFKWLVAKSFVFYFLTSFVRGVDVAAGWLALPHWISILDCVDKTSGKHHVTIPHLNFSYSFTGKDSINASSMNSYKITEWTIPGKFGFFNIYRGCQLDMFSTDASENIYEWDVNDWKFEDRNRSLIQTKNIPFDELSGKVGNYITFSDVDFETSQFLFSTLGSGYLLDFVYDKKLRTSLRTDNYRRFYYLLPFKDLHRNHTYHNIYTGQHFDNKKFCIAQPNSLDERCIMCNDCCFDTLCTEPFSSMYRIDLNASLSWR